jgi:hypothetical protein
MPFILLHIEMHKINMFHNIVANVGSMFFVQYLLYTLMVFDKWQNGILIAFIVNGKSWENDLDPHFQTLSKRMPRSWMPSDIFVDNVQAEINVLRFDFIKFTYNSMYINNVL